LATLAKLRTHGALGIGDRVMHESILVAVQYRLTRRGHNPVTSP
jgi:hypothetical protein